MKNICDFVLQRVDRGWDENRMTSVEGKRIKIRYLDLWS